MIYFEPLQRKHFSIIHEWFNKPHVQSFYSLRHWTLEEVKNKLSPYIDGNVHGFLISNGSPIGYIQYYSIKDYPWNGQDLTEDIVKTGAGLDLFIGEEEYIGKGIGKEAIKAFLEEMIWNKYDYCVVDPHKDNLNSIKLFESCGFRKHKEIESENALKEKTILSLYIKKK